MKPQLDNSTISGVGCLLFAGQRLVLEIQKPHKWTHAPGQSPVIGVGCIGGHIEAGETPLQTLQREAVEEIQCGIDLWSARQTAAISPAEVRLLDGFTLDGLVPAMVWEIAGPGLTAGFKVAVYLGRTMADPQPDDLPAIILAQANFIETLDAGAMTVQQARDAGAQFRTRIDLPANGRLVAANSLRCLLDLRQTHPSLYREFTSVTTGPSDDQ